MKSSARIIRLAILLSLSSAAGPAFGANFADNFADRQPIGDAPATVLGSNTTATLELGEPRHAGKPGGHSVWIAWTAPTNGLVTLSTAGSTFDTLLAIYTTEREDSPSVRNLERVAANDDDGLAKSSRVQFGARAGVEYEIAVDGFSGDSGDITLNLTFAPSAGLLPQVLRQAGDAALRLGDTLILTYDLLASDQMELSWFFNGHPVPNAEAPSLVIRNLQATNLGIYSLRLEVAGESFFGGSIEIQANSEGLATVLARDKLEDSSAGGLAPEGEAPASANSPRTKSLAAAAGIATGVVLGYDGTQIFNTTYATSDPAEPQHCGVAGGASYWFSYTAPTNGVMNLDTDGSGFDTLLAVYTYDPPLLGYQSLISVACDNNSGSNGLTSRLQFNTEPARSYFVVIDGVNAARGIAYLNYHLSTTNDAVLQAPAIKQNPQSLFVSSGTTVALKVVAGGTAPLEYQWLKDGHRLSGQTNATLTLLSPRPSDTGAYTVGISNLAGVANSPAAAVRVLASSSMIKGSASNQLIAAFPATRGYQYAVEATSLLLSNTWNQLATALTDYGGMIWMTNSLDATNQQFMRIRRL